MPTIRPEIKGPKVARPDLFGSHELSSNPKDVMAKAGVIDVSTILLVDLIISLPMIFRAESSESLRFVVMSCLRSI
jgi:hypothetical protein